MSSRFRFRLLTLFVITAGVALVLFVCIRLWNNCNHVETLDCGAERRIIITGDLIWEKSRPLYYEVVMGTHVSTAKCFFDALGPDEEAKFTVVTANNGELIGVVSEDRDVVIVHDFATGDSWPALFMSLGRSNAAESRLKRAFQCLVVQAPDLHMSMVD